MGLPKLGLLIYRQQYPGISDNLSPNPVSKVPDLQVGQTGLKIMLTCKIDGAPSRCLGVFPEAISWGGDPVEW
jgi:hypothetical protein